MGAWDTPPTPEEMKAAADPWAAPPTPEEVRDETTTETPAPPEDLSTKVRRFFDPSYGRPNSNPLTDIAKQGLKAASFAVPGVVGGSRLVAGGLAGGLYGAGSTDAKDAAGVAGDVALSAAGGAAVGKALDAASPFAKWLYDKSIRFGRNAIAGVTNSLARRKPLPPEVVEQAFKVGAIRPGYNVENVANKLQDAADPLSQRYGEILADLEAKGVTGPNAQQMAAQLAKDAQQASNTTIIGTRADALQNTADALMSKPTVNANRDLGLMQTELMKRELQSAAANDYVKEGSKSLSGAARKEIAGRFRGAIEDAVASQASKAPDEAAAFVPVKEELSRTLQALGAAREGAARYARRTPFGLHEAIGMASGIATGNPVEAAGAAGLMHVLKDRGASTLASAFHGGSRAVGALGGAPVPAPTGGVVIPESLRESFIDWLRRRGVSVSPASAVAEDQKK